MLVLTRKSQQRIRIADNVEIVVLGVQGGRVKLGIECPSEMPIRRTELLAREERRSLATAASES
jgi:carbon storage regulator